MAALRLPAIPNRGHRVVGSPFGTNLYRIKGPDSTWRRRNCSLYPGQEGLRPGCHHEPCVLRVRMVIMDTERTKRDATHKRRGNVFRAHRVLTRVEAPIRA